MLITFGPDQFLKKNPHQANIVRQPGEAGLSLVRLGPPEPLTGEGHHLLGLRLPLEDRLVSPLGESIESTIGRELAETQRMGHRRARTNDITRQTNPQYT